MGAKYFQKCPYQTFKESLLLRYVIKVDKYSVEFEDLPALCEGQRWTPAIFSLVRFHWSAI